MEKSDQLYLNDILDAITRIKKFTEGMALKEFVQDELVQSAVIRQLEIVGEAGNKVSKDLQNEFDNIPWREIIGTRNKLIHDYSGVDIILVWNIVVKELNSLDKNIEKIFKIKGYKRVVEDKNKKLKKILKKAKKLDD
ncbi:Uncharacterized conserved protein, contains HEPN domain [Orenia metallireducens]|uniref:Uncharacterized conserved protein, contains HEPN domain n=1 Tax=Orenia metallireducens TaxID=1413210 RepID=A0A285I0J4_9FIRM|nr:DUF86 domain-containing protein [Orenia metallireducens]SNY41468.1 Uncharacterized conserved protein, contains HEPN domain [Orenia metallireducens]